MGVSEPLIQASLLGEAVEHGPAAVFVADEDRDGTSPSTRPPARSSATPARSCSRCSVDGRRERRRRQLGARCGRRAASPGPRRSRARTGRTLLFTYVAGATVVAGMPVYVSVGSAARCAAGRDRRRAPAADRTGLLGDFDAGAGARRAAARRRRTRGRAAPAASGRDLNSGWNCEATNHGWSGSSMISTSRPSWNVPLTTRPGVDRAAGGRRCSPRSGDGGARRSRSRRRRPSRVRVPSASSTACAPRRIVPPRSSISFCSGSRSITGNGVSGSISVEFAPSRPQT